MRYMMIVSGAEDFAKPGPRPAALIEAVEKLGEFEQYLGSAAK